jgi:hypothetical protein
MNASPTAPRWLLLIAVIGMAAAAAAIIAATHTGGHAHRPPAAARRGPIIQGGLAPTPPLPRPRVAPALSALQTTETFAGGYINFLYGHRPASGVPYASRSLLARLAQLHPQLPGAIAATASPQLTSVRVTPIAANVARSTAVIEDGPAINSIAMRLAKHRGAWTVVDLSENG